MMVIIFIIEKNCNNHRHRSNHNNCNNGDNRNNRINCNNIKS